MNMLCIFQKWPVVLKLNWRYESDLSRWASITSPVLDGWLAIFPEYSKTNEVTITDYVIFFFFWMTSQISEDSCKNHPHPPALHLPLCLLHVLPPSFSQRFLCVWLESMPAGGALWLIEEQDCIFSNDSPLAMVLPVRNMKTHEAHF